MNSIGSNFLGLKMNGRKNRNANLPKKLHDLNLSCFIRLSVLLGLCGYTLFIVYRGPFSMLLRNTTVIRENEITIEDEDFGQPIIDSSLSVCKYPIYKNATKYNEFMTRISLNDFQNETEFNAIVDEVFYTIPEDFFLGFNMAPSYSAVVQNISRMPIADPYVKIIHIDYLYNGFCAVLSYEAMTNLMIEQNEVESGQKDFSFYTSIFLNAQNMQEDGVFFFKFITKGEDIFAAAETVSNSFVGEISGGICGIYLLNYEIEKKIRKCDNVRVLTPCVNEHFEKVYGNNYTARYRLTSDRTITAFDGSYSLHSKTKCQSPCKQTRYEVKEYRTMKIEYLPDPYVQKFLGEFNDTKASVIVINHQKSKTIQEHLEVIEYDGYKFISDAGGAIGIFVGMSFWSVYVDTFAPWIKWMERKMNKSFNR